MSEPGYFVVPGFVLAVAFAEFVSVAVSRLSVITTEISVVGTGL